MPGTSQDMQRFKADSAVTQGHITDLRVESAMQTLPEALFADFCSPSQRPRPQAPEAPSCARRGAMFHRKPSSATLAILLKATAWIDIGGSPDERVLF